MAEGIYAQIKSQIGARDVAIFYGHQVNRHGMMCCPFHDDKNPSLKIDQNFICFGCGEKGDVIAFSSKLFGLTPFDAAQKLIRDMGLNVQTYTRYTIRRPAITRKPSIHIKTKREIQQEKEKLYKRIYNCYCRYLHVLEDAINDLKPTTGLDNVDSLYIEAVQKIAYAEYIVDMLLWADEDVKQKIITEKAPIIGSLERHVEMIDNRLKCCRSAMSGNAVYPVKRT